MRFPIHLKSVAGSSVTTVAGFVALCFMTFALGRDLGIVMAKGVMIGVICCVTILPSLVLVFDKPIEKTKHKLLLSNMDKPSAFITKHYKVWIVVFLVLLFPAFMEIITQRFTTTLQIHSRPHWTVMWRMQNLRKTSI